MYVGIESVREKGMREGGREGGEEWEGGKRGEMERGREQCIRSYVP